MLSSEFASNYSDLRVVEPDLGPELNAIMLPCRQWSARLGKLLHGKLAGAALDPLETAETFAEYFDWLEDEFNTGIADQVRSSNEPNYLRASMEANFHNLSGSMLDLWGQSLLPESRDMPSRQLANRTAQLHLGIAGTRYALYRDSNSEIENDYVYLQDRHADYRKNNEAQVTEYDAAIALISVARNKGGWIILPAPAQFEHGPRQAFNVDFIVIDTKNQRACGVQVKTHVTHHHREVYDESIALIDGDRDLGNCVIHRYVPKTTKERQFTWAGVLCAQYLLDTSLKQQLQHMQASGSSIRHANLLVKYRRGAEDILNGRVIDIGKTSQKIGEKVIEKL